MNSTKNFLFKSKRQSNMVKLPLALYQKLIAGTELTFYHTYQSSWIKIRVLTTQIPESSKNKERQSEVNCDTIMVENETTPGVERCNRKRNSVYLQDGCGTSNKRRHTCIRVQHVQERKPLFTSRIGCKDKFVRRFRKWLLRRKCFKYRRDLNKKKMKQSILKRKASTIGDSFEGCHKKRNHSEGKQNQKGDTPVSEDFAPLTPSPTQHSPCSPWQRIPSPNEDGPSNWHSGNDMSVKREIYVIPNMSVKRKNSDMKDTEESSTPWKKSKGFNSSSYSMPYKKNSFNQLKRKLADVFALMFSEDIKMSCSPLDPIPERHASFRPGTQWMVYECDNKDRTKRQKHSASPVLVVQADLSPAHSSSEFDTEGTVAPLNGPPKSP